MLFTPDWQLKTPQWMDRYLKDKSTAELKRIQLEALELYFSSRIELPLTVRKSPDILMQEALHFYFRCSRRFHEPQLPQFGRPVPPELKVRAHSGDH